jgi:hypothetical protein
LINPYEHKNFEVKQRFLKISLLWKSISVKDNLTILEKFNSKIHEITEFHGFESKFFSDEEKIEENILTEKFPNGLENLNSISLLNCPSKNINSIIFKNVKILKGLKLYNHEDKQTFIEFLSNHPALEELKIDIYGDFKFEKLGLPNLKKLKLSTDIKFFIYKTLIKFPKLECFYLQNANLYDEEKKIFKIKGLFSHVTSSRLCKKDFKILSFLIKNKQNNNSYMKNCYLEANNVKEIKKFFNFLQNRQFQRLTNSIKSIVVSGSTDNEVNPVNKKLVNVFSNLHFIKIPSENYLPLLSLTKTLDKVEIEEIGNYDCNNFDYLKDKKISEIIINEDCYDSDQL